MPGSLFFMEDPKKGSSGSTIYPAVKQSRLTQSEQIKNTLTTKWPPTTIQMILLITIICIITKGVSDAATQYEKYLPAFPPRSGLI